MTPKVAQFQWIGQPRNSMLEPEFEMLFPHSAKLGFKL